jgi:hypothetical protein
MLDTEELREKELKALEGYLGEKLAFTLPETARVLGRSIKWVQLRVGEGKLRTVRLGRQRLVTRPVLISALTEGV